MSVFATRRLCCHFEETLVLDCCVFLRVTLSLRVLAVAGIPLGQIDLTKAEGR